MKQLRWVSSQNIPGCEKCILASLEFPFFTHGEVSTEICITNAHFISRIPQKRRSVEEEQICFPLWTFSIHRDIIVIYGHEASWKHTRSEVTNIYHRNVKLFFIQTQTSMFCRPSETSNIGIDQVTNRPIEYCEFVIRSILLFIETLTFKPFLGHGQHFQVLGCLSVFFKKKLHLYPYKDIFLWREAYSRQASGEGSFPRNVCTLSIDSSTHKKHLGKPLSRPTRTTTLKSKVRADFLDAFIE